LNNISGFMEYAQIRAELDATYARLYGLTRDELRYTLRVDPKEVHGEDSSTLPTVAGRVSLAKPSACGKRKDQALDGVPGSPFPMKKLVLLTAIPYSYFPLLIIGINQPQFFGV